MTKVTYNTTTLQEILVRSSNSWAKLQWDARSGQVTITSDYGHWSYYWYSIGTQTLAKFLSGLDHDYMGNKMLGTNMYVFNEAETAQAIWKEIVRNRRDKVFSKSKARTEFENLQYFADGEYDFRMWVENSTIPDAWDCSRTTTNPTWMNFWNRMWIPFIKPKLLQISQET